MQFTEDPMETIAATKSKPQKSRSRVNSGVLTTKNEESYESTTDKVFVLERDSQGHRGKGYFFLALMFGMMCCSSQQTIAQPETAKSPRTKNFIMRDIKSTDEMASHFGNMNLISSDVSDEFIPEQELIEVKPSLQETAHLMKSVGSIMNTQ